MNINNHYGHFIRINLTGLRLIFKFSKQTVYEQLNIYFIFVQIIKLRRFFDITVIIR